MKSTGEVMGVAADYPAAFGKAQAAAGSELPTAGTVFISVTDGDKPAATQLAAGFCDMGFSILATGGTAQAIRRMGVPVERIKKLSEGSPNVVDRIEAREVDLVINTPTGSGARADGYEIRRAAVGRGIPCITTMSGASAAQRAIRARRTEQAEVISLQELHGGALGRFDHAQQARQGGRRGHVSGAATAAEPRTLAPPERRVADGVRRGARSAPTRWSARSTPASGARAAPGPVLHARRGRGLGRRGRTSAPTCRAPSRTRAPPGTGRHRALLPARGGGAGHGPAGRAPRG